MYTVKWVAANGSEFLYSDAREISYSPRSEHNALPGRAVVSFYYKGQQSKELGDSHVIIDSGRVFVMNAAGRTVADYALDDDNREAAAA